MHPFLDFICDQLVSQRVNDICIHQTLPQFCFIDRGKTKVELLMNVTYFKKISMNSYFFFGFNIFKEFTVTFMCQYFPKSIINGSQN